MNLRSSQGGALIRSGLALVLASMALLPSPAAQAHMNGSMGSHGGGRCGAQFNRGAGHVPGAHHRGSAGRSFHRHAGVVPFALIGGAGFLYPYASPYYSYPYGYDGLPATPVWYYCDAVGTYYPYVTTCPGEWSMVPAPPQQAYPPPQE